MQQTFPTLLFSPLAVLSWLTVLWSGSLEWAALTYDTGLKSISMDCGGKMKRFFAELNSLSVLIVQEIIMPGLSG